MLLDLAAEYDRGQDTKEKISSLFRKIVYLEEKLETSYTEKEEWKKKCLETSACQQRSPSKQEESPCSGELYKIFLITL